MLVFPAIDPVALTIGPLKIHWYGLMYIIGFMGGWWLLTVRARQLNSGWTKQEVSDVLFYVALGVILGGRIGYMLFYNVDTLLAEPLSLFKTWQGGMSFHGGLLGVLFAVGLYTRCYQKSFFQVTDFIAPVIPIGLGAGRIGNFINGELWGKATDVPWAMVFPQAGLLPRHPSQLYEFALEGVVLFLILWLFSAKPRPRLAVSALFLICYGLFRFTIEFFREPDIQKGYIAFDWLTMGQILSIPMIVIGMCFMWWAYHKQT